MKPIVWLASYPKSGNTWFRIFLTNFLRNGDAPANINSLDGGPIASARQPFDEALGYDSGELSFDETDALRPEYYLRLARLAKTTPFVKVHDAYTFLPDGRPLFPPEATACAIYFVRNPLDVAVSYAHHGGHDRFDKVVKRLGKPEACLSDFVAAESNQLRQKMLTWTGHVASWADAPDQRVLVIRYEDMKLKPEETFGAAVRFAGLPDDPARVKKAIEFSRFDELKKQEQEKGFGEKLVPAKAFFRKGEIGSWRESLTPELAARVVAEQAEGMRRWGYLDAAGAPLF